jgi:hypothetical protein
MVGGNEHAHTSGSGKGGQGLLSALQCYWHRNPRISMRLKSGGFPVPFFFKQSSDGWTSGGPFRRVTHKGRVKKRSPERCRMHERKGKERKGKERKGKEWEVRYTRDAHRPARYNCFSNRCCPGSSTVQHIRALLYR